jgi:thiol-disulfide isomerase/thioredoxin
LTEPVDPLRSISFGLRRLKQRIMLSIRSISRYLLLLTVFAFSLSSIPAFPSARDTLQELYPGMSFGVLRFARLSDLPKGIVLESDEVTIHESLLLRMVEKESPEFREELKKNLVYVLEQELNNRLLLSEAYKNGYPKEVPEDQTVSYFRNSKIPALSVSDEDTKAFYEENSVALGNLPFEQVADGVKEYLLDQKREEAYKAYLLDLARSKSIRIQSSWAKENAALARDNPVDQARSSEKPTLVEFGRIGCTACDMMQPILMKLEERFFGKMNIVFVDVHRFPFLASRYSINLIPVQAFFDKTGKEIFRHVGFYPQTEIEKKLAEMGVK